MMKSDRYSRARPGGSHILEISCAACGSFVMRYRKDGIGSLIRCYVDRIIEPAGTDPGQPLRCPRCQAAIGTPMVYAKERRPAFRLVPGGFRKKAA